MRIHSICLGLGVLGAAAWVWAAPLDGREVADDVFYMYMPIAWRDSDSDTYRFGDFGGMTAALDYLEDLGVTAVWMTPIFPSPAYHGYQHGAGDEINPRLGDETGFLDFVAAAHARGIKVFIDFVVYGISHDSLWYQSAYGNPASPYDDWFSFTNYQNTQSDLSFTYSTWNGDTVGFIHWNLNNADCTDLITNWALHWLDPDGDLDPADGIDGFRLDHVSAYHADESPWGYDIDWWIAWKAELSALNPDVFTFAEQADWGSHGVDLLPAHDATMTKPFLFAARDALANETAGPLYDQMSTTVASLPPGKTYLGTLGDHDLDRLTSVLGDSLTKAKVAAAVLMTQPFPPVIYFGDELGMLGTKQDYGSDANDIPMREPFKWNAVAGAPMSNYHHAATNPDVYNNAFSQDNDGRSVEEQDGVSGSLLEEYKLLIAARKDHAALRRGSYHAIDATSSRVWAFLRYQEGEETLLVAMNVYASARTPDLDLSNTEIPGGSTTVQDIITGGFLPDITDANKSAYSIALPAYSYRILAVNLAPLLPPVNEIDGVDIPDSLGSSSLVATQDNATGLGDNISELDQLFARSEADGLRMGITGNLAVDGTGLVLLFDTTPGGQNPLDTEGYPSPGAVAAMDGLRLDNGFVPDFLIYINTYSSSIWVDEFTLPESGSTTKTYRGKGTVNDGDGNLDGGTNPNGMQMAMNNTNVLGVTDTDASSAATAVNGFDMFIPFADIGVTGGPNGTIGVVAYIVRSNPAGDVGNQWLPGLGGGFGNLGMAPDMTTIPGDQFAVVTLDIPGDWDGDGDVDRVDYGHFPGCLTGPDNGPPGSGCDIFDFDTDTDVDLEDFGAFQFGFID